MQKRENRGSPVRRPLAEIGKAMTRNVEWPPDPEKRSPRNGGNRARAKSQIEVVNSIEITLPARQAQQISRRYSLTLSYAETVVALHFGGRDR